MITFAYYLVKVIICSGLLFFYYHVALRNKLFHQWNRFYLLASIVLSLIVPCLEFKISATNAKEPASIRLLNVVYTADEYVAEINTRQALISNEQWGILAYSFVSIVVLALFILALLRIRAIVRSHPVVLIDDIKFVNTAEKDTPFSFLNYVFWNNQIELNSSSGEHIFKHELVHVREKHSWDKIFLQLVLIVYWCNPFFWLVRRELKMIHEFIADQKSVGQSDARAFAAMILQSTYPTHYNYLTNQFFQSSIKRRLIMLTKNHNPKFSYISRILALPLFAFILLAFTLKEKQNGQNGVLTLDKEITVIIDAGHGGGTGAKVEGYTEDDLVLQLAKTVRRLNNNDKIRILLTRENEEIVALKDRVEFAKKNNADLFISLHVNAAPALSSAHHRTDGYEIAVSGEPLYQKHSELLGAALVQELSKSYKTFPSLVKAGAWVLDQNVCPSVLIECGYITDKNDREFIIKRENQELIAQKILRAVELYSSTLEGTTGQTTPQVKEIASKQSDTTKPIRITLNTETLEDSVDGNFLVIVDGIEKGKAKNLKLEKLVPEDQIERIDMYKGDAAIQKFGANGKEGVIIITTKKSQNLKTITNKIQNQNIQEANRSPMQNQKTDVSVQAVAPVVKAHNSDNALLIVNGVDKGTVKDIGKHINVNQIQDVNVLKGTAAVQIYGDKAKHGVVLVTTREPNINNKIQAANVIFDQVEKPAEFPGGTEAWRRYLQRQFNASVPSQNGAPDGSYTVELQFMVNLDGFLSDIKATTKHGYGMEEEAIRFLSRGPKWIPAQQNGQNVVSHRKQTITFVIKTD